MSVNVDLDEKIKIDEKIKKEIREPSKYNVIFLNERVKEIGNSQEVFL